ncbi:MAG: hypothetical protein ACI9MR_002467 [Myxococcota bacterium]|jgi:hypothetical protein
MMVIYEVNLAVDQAITRAFEKWLGTHIAEMVEIDGFFRARWYNRRPQDESGAPEGGKTLWTVQYDVYTRADLDRYFANDAARMREDGVKRFGGGFSASRRILYPRSLGGGELELSDGAP